MQQLILAQQAEFPRCGKKIRREQFLEEMDTLIPWVELLALVAPYYSKSVTERKPVGLEIMLRAYFLQLSGVTVVFYYGPAILEKAGFSLGDALGRLVSIGIVNTVFAVIAIWLMDSLRRRPLLFVGAAGAFFALASIGLLFQFGHTRGPLIVGMMCLFVACFAFSMGPIKWVVISQIFPTRIRGRAAAIATLALWVTDGVHNQLFPMDRNSLGMAGVFSLSRRSWYPSSPLFGRLCRKPQDGLSNKLSDHDRNEFNLVCVRSCA